MADQPVFLPFGLVAIGNASFFKRVKEMGHAANLCVQVKLFWQALQIQQGQLKCEKENLCATELR